MTARILKQAPSTQKLELFIRTKTQSASWLSCVLLLSSAWKNQFFFEKWILPSIGQQNNIAQPKTDSVLFNK